MSKSNIWDILGKKSLRERKQKFTKPMGRKKSLTGRKFASSTRKREESRQRWRWACECGLGKELKLRVAVAMAVTAEERTGEVRGFFFFFNFYRRDCFWNNEMRLDRAFFHIHADWWAGTSLEPLDAFNGWDLCYCTPCNTLGIARDMNPVKGYKVLGFAAFSLWYLCSQSQVVTYSLLVHVWFDYIMRAQIIIQIPIVSII